MRHIGFASIVSGRGESDACSGTGGDPLAHRGRWNVYEGLVGARGCGRSGLDEGGVGLNMREMGDVGAMRGLAQ